MKWITILTIFFISIIFINGCKETKCRKGMHDWIVNCANKKRPDGYGAYGWMDECEKLARQEYCYEVEKRK